MVNFKKAENGYQAKICCSKSFQQNVCKLAGSKGSVVFIFLEYHRRENRNGGNNNIAWFSNLQIVILTLKKKYCVLLTHLHNRHRRASQRGHFSCNCKKLFMKWTLGVALHDCCVQRRCLDMIIPHIDKGLNTRFTFWVCLRQEIS